jgi:hypothetical protein
MSRSVRLPAGFSFRWKKSERIPQNPVEGGSNDVPISSIARRVEIEMRVVLSEQTDLKPIEAKHNILF